MTIRTPDGTLRFRAVPTPEPTARVTAQAGDWTDPATWDGGVVPLAIDSATIDHAVAVDDNATIAGLEINAPLTIAMGMTLTLAGDVAQGNATVTMEASSALVFDCTDGDRKWLVGTGWNQANAKFVANGLDAARCSISKVGGNAAWFDSGDEGSGSFGNSSAWSLTCCDVTGIGKADGTVGIRTNNNGGSDSILDRCVFDDCGTIFAHSLPWSALPGNDYLVLDCRWTNTPAGSVGLDAYSDGNTGAGVRQIIGNSFDVSINLGINGMECEDNYFRVHPIMSGAPHATFERNFVRQTTRNQTTQPSGDMLDVYMFADHDEGALRGNPHFLSPFAPGTFDGIIFEYPHESILDAGDGMYGAAYLTSTFIRLLVIPSATDGLAACNIGNPGTGGTDDITCLHCTVAGGYAELVRVEYSQSGNTPWTTCRSNLVASPDTNPTYCAHFLNDLDAATIGQLDIIAPANCTHNYIQNPVSYTDPVTSDDFPGFRGRFTDEPAGPTTVATGSGFAAGPDFVDPTRNVAEWAVSKGAIGSGATLRQKIDAALALLAADPYLIGSELIPWVRAGFAPQNPALDGTAHDGGTIGAVPYAGA